MYTTQNNRQREKQYDSEEEEAVGTERCIQLRTIDREIVSQRGGGGSRYRQMYTTKNNKQIKRQLDREEEEAGTDKCIQLKTIDREIVRQRGR